MCERPLGVDSVENSKFAEMLNFSQMVIYPKTPPNILMGIFYSPCI